MMCRCAMCAFAHLFLIHITPTLPFRPHDLPNSLQVCDETWAGPQSTGARSRCRVGPSPPRSSLRSYWSSIDICSAHALVSTGDGPPTFLWCSAADAPMGARTAR